MQQRTIRLNCPYCNVLVEIDPPEAGGPVAGENLICSACDNVFMLNERVPTGGPREVIDRGEVIERSVLGRSCDIFAKVGAVARGAVVALALLTLMSMMFVFGSVYGEDVFRIIAAMFN